MTEAEAKTRPMTAEEKEELWQLDRKVPTIRSRRIVNSGATSEYSLRVRSSPDFAVLRARAVGLVASGVAPREVAAELSLTTLAIRKWVAKAAKAAKEGEGA